MYARLAVAPRCASLCGALPAWAVRRSSTAFAASHLTHAADAAPLSATTEAAAPPAAVPGEHVKTKNAFKRASSIMHEIRTEAWERMQLQMASYRPPLPPFNVGDAVEITYANEHSETNPVAVRGTVISKVNKGIDSKFTIINAWDEEWYTATYTFASPLLRGVKVMMRNRHTEGAKRARRAKLTYLFEKDPKTYYVDQHTREAAEILAEKLERREAQRQGKVYKKDKPAPAGGAKKAAPKKGGKK